MTILIGILWFASLVGLLFSLLDSQYLFAGTMLMNLILSTIMIMERIDR